MEYIYYIICEIGVARGFTRLTSDCRIIEAFVLLGIIRCGLPLVCFGLDMAILLAVDIFPDLQLKI